MVRDYSRLKSVDQKTLTKVCKICKTNKSVEDFKIRKDSSGVVFKIEYCCHNCTLDSQRKYRENNREKLRLQYKKYSAENKEKRKKQSKEYRERNSEKFRLKRLLTKEQQSILWKNWSEKNKEYRKQYKASRREITNRQDRERRQNDLDYNLKQLLRGRLYKAIKAQNTSKNNSVIDLIGCSIEDFKKHIESQFHNGMCWENHSVHGWHLDHILPCAYFDLTDPEEQKKCFHYSNFQPLWWIDNLNKRDLVAVYPDGRIEGLKVAK